MDFSEFSGDYEKFTEQIKSGIYSIMIIHHMASPVLALIMSFFIPGLGQLYTGQFLKAVALFILAVIFGGLSFILIGIPFYVIVWIYSMFDAYTTAKSNKN